MTAGETSKSSFKAPFSYEVRFVRNSFDPANGDLRDIVASASPEGSPKRCLFILERSLSEAAPALRSQIEAYCEAHAGDIALAAPVLVTEGGEKAKSMDNALALCERMSEAKLCRKSFAVVVGGGALLDVAGFAAALLHRGVRQIRMPSTVLSQCDSGVGVKNAVNFLGQKNLLGTFAPPYAVIDDFELLSFLPPREIRAGAAEALKVSLIKDAEFFSWLCSNAKAVAKGSKPEMETMVRRCAELHVKHISEGGDPFENGDARPLDFGHWAAHKLEMLSEGRLRHGEAVAIGMLIDCEYAARTGLAGRSVFDALLGAVRSLGLPVADEALEIRSKSGRRLVLDGLEEFREHLGGCLHVTLPTRIGWKTEVTSIDLAQLEASIETIVKTAKEAQWPAKS